MEQFKKHDNREANKNMIQNMILVRKHAIYEPHHEKTCCSAHKRLYFHYIEQSLYFLNPKFQASNQLETVHCTSRFVSDFVGNPKDKFSHDAAQIICKHSRNIIIKQLAKGIIFLRKHATLYI